MTDAYVVVRNSEEQFSIWNVTYNAAAKPPAGWDVVAAAPKGTKDECLAWIGDVWTDLTPKTVRLQKERETSK
jgi:MbtH protein